MKILERKAHQMGVTCYCYLDNILITGKTAAEAAAGAQVWGTLLHSAGFTVNAKTFVFVPGQAIDFLGFTLDFKTGTITVPKAKLKSYRTELTKAGSLTRLTPRRAAALWGKISSLLPAFPQARLTLRTLHTHTKKAEKWGWDTALPIDNKILFEETELLKTAMGSLRGRQFGAEVRAPAWVIYTNASDAG